MKKSLTFLIAVLLTAGLATAQMTGGDKAPKAGKTVVQTDAPAEPRGLPTDRVADKPVHPSSTYEYKVAQKKRESGKKIKITPDPSCTGSRCNKGI